MSVSIFLTALLTSKLVALVQQTSPYDGSYKRDTKRLHIVVLGRIKYTTLKEFMREFTKHDLYARSKIVIMSSDKPSTEIKALLKIPYYKRRVSWIRGSEMVISDLERIDMKHAAACFVLANRYVKDAQQVDAETIMRCLAVRSFSKQVNIFAQIIKTENKSHATQSGVFRIMCLQEFTMNILARNCIAPGFSTLIANLLRTFPSNFEYEGWKEEYYDGCTQQIYGASFPSALIGRSFLFCVRFLYEKFRVLLIGVKVVAQKKVHITPLDHVIGVNDVAFVIAQSQAEANRVTNYTPDDEECELPKQEIEMNIKPNLSNVEISKMPSSTFLSYNDLFRPYLETITGPWSSLYHVHEEPIDLTKVTKKSIKFTGHIVVTGSLTGLADFILPLRSRKIRDMVKIVILNPIYPDQDVWDNIGVFPEVYFVQGTAPSDLRRAGANGASKVVFLSDPSCAAECDLFRDANNVITARVTESQNHPYFITTEFAEETSIKFLSIHKGQNEEEVESFSEDFADALSWLTDNEDPNALPEYHFSEYFISGQVFASSMLDSLLCQYFYNPYLSFMIKEIIGGDKPNNRVNSHFYQIDVPEEYHEKPYDALFNFLLQFRIVSIGLYRDQNPQNAPAPYVYTNPRPDTIVYAKDKVFVMALREPVVKGQSFATVISTSTPYDFASPIPGSKESMF